MAFLDKLNEFTKTATEKTNAVIETGKLTIKIKEAEKDIDENVAKIGDFYLDSFDAGAEVPEEIKDFYAEIIAKRELISQLNAQISELKAPKEEAAAETKAAEEKEEPAEEVKGGFCTECGAAVAPGAKFCASCGAKLGE